MAVIHKLGCASILHDGMTTCGLIATHKVAEGEYYCLDKNATIKTIRDTWEGVTCKSCLRNPHAPGNRLHQQQRETR